MAHADIVLIRKLLDQVMVVSRKQRPALDLLRQLFDNTVGDRGAVERSRATTQLVHQHQRVLRSMVQDRASLTQLQEERALTGQDLITSADTRENPVNGTQAAAARRHVTAHLG